MQKADAALTVKQTNPWLVAVAVVTATFLEVLDTSIVNLSLPNIAGNLSSGVEEASWVLTSYLVANAIVVPASGWLQGRFGSRKLLLFVVSGFIVASMLCGLATSLPMLIIFRCLQGFIGGSLQAISLTVLARAFPGKAFQKGQTLYLLGILVAPILGPLVGGFITENYSWRWLFYINLPVGCFSLWMIYRYVWDGSEPKRNVKFDLLSFIYMAIGFGSLSYVLDHGQKSDWLDSVEIRVALAAAAAGLITWLIRQSRVAEPILDLSILKRWNSTYTLLMLGFIMMVLYSGLVLVPLYGQVVMGWGTLDSGWVTSFRGLAIMPVVLCLKFQRPKRFLKKATYWIPGVAWIFERIDPRQICVIGLGISGMSFWMASGLSFDVSPGWLAKLQFLTGVGLGLVFQELQALFMESVPPALKGHASALYGTVRNLAGSSGIALITTYLARYRQIFHAQLAAHAYPGNPAFDLQLHAGVAELIRRGYDQQTAVKMSLAIIERKISRNAELLSYSNAFWLMAVAFFVLAAAMLAEWAIQRWVRSSARAGSEMAAAAGSTVPAAAANGT